MAKVPIRFVPHPVNIRVIPLTMAAEHVRVTGVQIRRAAVRIAGIDRSPFRRPGPHLKRSITDEVRITGPTRVQSRVGSNLSHALVHHEGAPPHMIFPRGSNNLRFFWQRVGRWVSMPRVSHPGHRANPYLTTPLLRIAPRRGYRVVISRTGD